MREYYRRDFLSGQHKPFVPFFKDGQGLMFDAGGVLYVDVGKEPFEKGLISPNGDHWKELKRIYEN